MVDQMARESSSASSIPFANPQQQQIYRRLKAIGPGPAAFYRDACSLVVGSPGLESTSHIVSHLLREIESGLRDALGPLALSSTEPERHGTGTKRSSRGTDQHRREIKEILDGLGISESEPVAEAWLALPGENNAYGLAARAHRDNLAPPRPLDADFSSFFRRFESILGEVLRRMETRFVAYINEIDRVLASSESPDAKLAHLKNLPNNPIIQENLLGKIVALNDPAWLEPLEKHDYFRHPPSAERSSDEAEGTTSVRFPYWPQSEFLVHTARSGLNEHSSERLAQIAANLPETDNATINEDLAYVALALPPELAAQLAPRLGRALESSSAGFFPDRVASLVIKLLEGSETAPGLLLARKLLALHSVPVAPLELGGEVLRFSPTVHGFFDDWMYERIVERLTPVLAAVLGQEALDLVCDLLDDAIALSRKEDDPGPPLDRSTHWWPNLDETDESKRVVAGIRATLVTSLRSLNHQLVAENPQDIAPQVLALVQARTWRIYRRLELDLVRTFASNIPALVERYLVDRELMDIEPLLPEYSRLSAERFSTLSPEAQQRVLQGIDEGLDRELIAGAFRRSGLEPTPEDMEREVRRLQWERLSAIRDALPASAREGYNALESEFGSPLVAEPQTQETPFIGPTSPVSVEDLTAMSVADIVAYLAGWQPTEGIGAPTPDGLGRVIEVSVQQNPARFTRDARQFINLDPTYVRSLVGGLRDAIRTNAAIDWTPVIDLCVWAVGQPRDIAGRDPSGHNADPSWGWARKEIARLILEGFVDSPNAIPLELRPHVWAVLEKLVADPDPSPEDEERYLEDPLDYGLNTVRPSALEAVIFYAGWVKKHVEAGAVDGATWQGFSTVPEVATVLGAHLDPTHDPSVSVRSVYGQYLPGLIYLDQEWVRNNVEQILPKAPDQVTLSDAAWEAYLVRNPAHRSSFDLLEAEYRNATLRLPDETERWPWRGRTSPTKKLGEHLTAAYMWGWIDLDASEGLLSDYFAQAPPAIRAYLVEWIGRELTRSLILAGPSEMTRLMALWESRITAAEAADNPEPFKDETAEFGWWFISGRFDGKWAASQLQRILLLGIKPAFVFRVISRLAELTDQTPLATVGSLNLMLQVEDLSDFELSSSIDEITTILNAAMSCNDADAKQVALEAANRLVARGFTGFAQLIRENEKGVALPDDHQASSA
jgi:hypothetical protein